MFTLLATVVAFGVIFYNKLLSFYHQHVLNFDARDRKLSNFQSD